MLIQKREEYDAIVVGSGISGGWAAKELCEKGLRTLVLERGRNVEHQKDYITEHKPNWEFPLRQRRIPPESPQAKDYQVQARTGQFVEAGVHFFVKDTKHPYIEEKPFCQNPSITYMALTARAADFAVREMQRRAL